MVECLLVGYLGSRLHVDVSIGPFRRADAQVVVDVLQLECDVLRRRHSVVVGVGHA